MKSEYGKYLSSRTSFKIGGPVFCWLEPENINDLNEAILLAEKNSKPLIVIGKGSNVLASDKGFDGVVVALGNDFDRIEIEGGGVVKAGAAVPVSRLVRECAGSGLTGCEFLSGIPGSVGGAVFMNAGVRNAQNAQDMKEIKDIILDIDIMDMEDRKIKSLKRDDIDFSYRSSGLKGKCILSARIKLQKAAKEAVNNRIELFMKRRAWIQNIGLPTAGSVFKNPDAANPAGRLIEECGLKGKRCGGAEISRFHANFIVNTGNAAAKDVMDLIELAKKSVKEKFNIDLELELEVI